MPITLTSSSSASRCLRMTETAVDRPSSVSTRWRSFSTVNRPSRSMRATVWLTVGPLWCSRSAMRARSGGTPSSSSSRMVRRYISVVSTRSFKASLPAAMIPRRRGQLRPRRGAVDQTLSCEDEPMADGTTAVIWDRALLGYDMGDHPLDPVRIELTMALAKDLGVLDRPGVRLVTPEPASEKALARVHRADYLDAVRAAPHDPFFRGWGLNTTD